MRRWPLAFHPKIKNSPDSPECTILSIIFEKVFRGVVNWSSVFCMFDMALTWPPLTMQLTSGVNVFAGKRRTLRATIVIKYSAIWRDVFVKGDTILRFRFLNYHKFELIILQGSVASCNILKMWWEVLYGFCWKFTSLSSSERILKIRWELTKLSPWAGIFLDPPRGYLPLTKTVYPLTEL